MASFYADTGMSPPSNKMRNFSLPSYSDPSTMFIDRAQPKPYPLRSNPPSLPLASPPLPTPPVPAKSPLRLSTGKSLQVPSPSDVARLEHCPQPLSSHLLDQISHLPSPLLRSVPSPNSTTSSSKSSGSKTKDASVLIIARLALVEEFSGDFGCIEIRKRVDDNNGKLLPAIPASPAFQETELDPVHYLRSLSRAAQLARVGDPERNIYLSPSKPVDLLRKKLKEGVIEKRRVQRQEGRTKGRPRRAMSTLRALMLKSDKQAEKEYFHRREEEEQVKKQVSKKRDEEEDASS